MGRVTRSAALAEAVLSRLASAATAAGVAVNGIGPIDLTGGGSSSGSGGQASGGGGGASFGPTPTRQIRAGASSSGDTGGGSAGSRVQFNTAPSGEQFIESITGGPPVQLRILEAHGRPGTYRITPTQQPLSGWWFSLGVEPHFYLDPGAGGGDELYRRASNDGGFTNPSGPRTLVPVNTTGPDGGVTVGYRPTRQQGSASGQSRASFSFDAPTPGEAAIVSEIQQLRRDVQGDGGASLRYRGLA